MMAADLNTCSMTIWIICFARLSCRGTFIALLVGILSGIYTNLFFWIIDEIRNLLREKPLPKILSDVFIVPILYVFSMILPILLVITLFADIDPLIFSLTWALSLVLIRVTRGVRKARRTHDLNKS